MLPWFSSNPSPADIDELSNPLQAAVVSAICFTVGAAIPLLSAAWIPGSSLRLSILAGATTGGRPCSLSFLQLHRVARRR